MLLNPAGAVNKVPAGEDRQNAVCGFVAHLDVKRLPSLRKRFFVLGEAQIVVSQRVAERSETGHALVVTLDDFVNERHGSPDDGVCIDRKSTRLNSSHLGISYAV